MLTYVYVHTHMFVCHVCLPLMSGIFLSHSALDFLRHGVSSSLELSDLSIQ